MESADHSGPGIISGLLASHGNRLRQDLPWFWPVIIGPVPRRIPVLVGGFADAFGCDLRKSSCDSGDELEHKNSCPRSPVEAGAYDVRAFSKAATSVTGCWHVKFSQM